MNWLYQRLIDRLHYPTRSQKPIPHLTWILAASVIGTLSFSMTPRTQAQAECYMQSSSGTLIDLSRLCGGGVTPPNATTSPASGGDATRNGRVFQVPIKRREGRLPIVDVTFNGRHRFEMIVDTGASGTLITANMARAMQLRPVGQTYVSTASQNNVPMAVTVLDSMEAGGVTARNLRVTVANQGLDIGLLGHDFFGNYDLTIRQDVVEFRPR